LGSQGELVSSIDALRGRAGALLIVACLALWLAGTAAAQDVTISRLEAHIFYDHTASFSRDVLADPGFLLRNVPVGGGSAEGPSNATLLLVRVSGPSGLYLPGWRVAASAQWSRTRTSPDGNSRAETARLDSEAEVGSFGADGYSFVGFWLAGTGCNPVTITVRLRTGSVEKPLFRASIPFTCGE
jgi:hypothetical protein